VANVATQLQSWSLNPHDDDTGRIDFAKLERITELAARLVWLAADGDAPRFRTQ